MNIIQYGVLGFGILFIAAIWCYNASFADSIDVPYLIVVSVMAAAMTAGFVFSCKNIGKK